MKSQLCDIEIILSEILRFAAGAGVIFRPFDLLRNEIRQRRPRFAARARLRLSRGAGTGCFVLPRRTPPLVVRTPKAAEGWSLTSLREKLIKIGARVVSHGRYVTFQMAEVAVPRQMFADILSLITRLRAPPAPA